MIKINSDDYHDFVIKDGNLIGEYEQMYQKSKNVPWDQHIQEDWLDVRVTLELLKEFSPFDYICDFGMGLGYFLDILCKNYGKPQYRASGYDISQTCCKKAKELFPYIEVGIMDLTKNNNNNNIIQEDNKKDKIKRLFSLRGILWYVFTNMENVVKNIASLTTEGDLLLISQNFPPLNFDFVGKSVIPNHNTIITWFAKIFTPLKTIWLEDGNSTCNDNWFIGVFRRI
tara:strand:+ start:64 stop:747 length:684 start_codon:yes stop_codon:yes gene_type:complete